MSLHSKTLTRVSVPHTTNCANQVRHATLLSRPHRPYTFTQLITLSDGSTYLTRTTSPAPVYRATKDTRNSILWQPSLSSLKNVEQDEAGRLRAFRDRFGRGWDLDAQNEEGGDGKVEGGKRQSEEDSLMDLISGSAGVKQRKSEGGGEGGEGDVKQKMVTVKVDGKLTQVPDSRRIRGANK